MGSEQNRFPQQERVTPLSSFLFDFASFFFLLLVSDPLGVGFGVRSGLLGIVFGFLHFSFSFGFSEWPSDLMHTLLGPTIVLKE